MNKQKFKRQALEQFTREQIVGPGAFNKRFFLLKKWEQNEFVGELLEDVKALENTSEVISEVPAYQYSSGILFPISITADNDSVENSEDSDNTEEEAEDFAKMDDEELEDEHANSVSSRNQNYPNTCGIAFATRAGVETDKSLSITVSYRKYRKLKQNESKDSSLGYWVSEYKSEIERIFATYYADVFDTVTKDNNLFITAKPLVDINAVLYDLDYNNAEKYLKAEIVPIVNTFSGSEEYFKSESKTYHGKTYDYTRFEQDKLLENVKKSLFANQSEYGKWKELIEALEVFNRVKTIVLELKTVYRASSMKSHPTPIWESTTYSHKLALEPYRWDGTIQRGELKIPTEEKLVLKYQYLPYHNLKTGTPCLYIKVVLVNLNEISIPSTDPPQLNKKDDANLKAFFGVNVKVSETTNGVIQEYNPPNLLQIDEEDNFNKLLYRQYKDYAEGYNTSVDWKIEDGLISISSEFLPNQEIPKVDFKPSRIKNGTVISRINEDILSIRKLSTLSTATDSEIISELHLFIDEYFNWIQEKRSELSQSAFDGDQTLFAQLKACEADYKRLKRNINILARNPDGMAAFRIMNTAMFMQLHHSINVKSVKKKEGAPFIPSENNFEYYKKLELKDEYKWRSFQIAFVILNIDAFIQPNENERVVPDVFETKWPERNEIADLVWFPTGGGKTEAYLGIIAFAICLRRFTKEKRAGGTSVLMRYTLRLLTLQQFQRATLLICALEDIRYNGFPIPNRLTLGTERITLGLFVGSGSLPNSWDGSPGKQDGMKHALDNISNQLKGGTEPKAIKTNLPFTDCPWCGGHLFIDHELKNVNPYGSKYDKNESMYIMCNTEGCNFNHKRLHEERSLPILLFDTDIYRKPPTLLFGTVDKFAVLANKVSTNKDEDSRRLFGSGSLNFDPPELIIQDELHLLLGPLGSAVGLYEKAIDELCTIHSLQGIIRPKVVTSTATTRNTDKQIFALFNRRSEIFPKQGISCDDSFFAYYERRIENGRVDFVSNRKYYGLLPIGKTQVWMQLRIASIALTHRVKFLLETFTIQEILTSSAKYTLYSETLDYYHTVLSYFNSLKQVGKTQSQLTHYLPGDIDLITRNVIPWSIIDQIIRERHKVHSSELTGRLNGEEVRTNLSEIERTWGLFNTKNPPDFVISTNMISVGIDVSRFNVMVISSMPRNTAEYIQASSRVARDKEGIVFTVHHPFRSRDISHYQKFREFHEKFYSYVEPISVTPFAQKALDRYFAMFLAATIRQNKTWKLSNNKDAANINAQIAEEIISQVTEQLSLLRMNTIRLNGYLKSRTSGIKLDIEGVFDDEEFQTSQSKLRELIDIWLQKVIVDGANLEYRNSNLTVSLFQPLIYPGITRDWKVKSSLREIAPETVIKTVQQ